MNQIAAPTFGSGFVNLSRARKRGGFSVGADVFEGRQARNPRLGKAGIEK